VSARACAGAPGFYRQFPDLDAVHGFNGGGAELKPERALHVDAGLEQMLPRQIRVLFNVYARQERDVLWTPNLEPRLAPNGAIVPTDFDDPWTNALRGDAHGVEVVMRRDAADGFSGWAGYAYGHLRYTRTETGEQFWADADQRHTVSLYGNYRLSSRASVSARYRYGSNYPMIGYIGEPSPRSATCRRWTAVRCSTGSPANATRLRLPAYSRFDVRADRAFNWSGRRLVLFVDVANIFNRTNLRNTPYGRRPGRRVFDPTESLLPIVPSGGSSSSSEPAYS
jgi:hypothetical protein